MPVGVSKFENSYKSDNFAGKHPTRVTGKKQKSRPLRQKKGGGKNGAKMAKNRPFYVQ